MKPKLKILIGISGSGKTTFSKKFVRDNKNWARVSRDDLRESLFGYNSEDVFEYYKKPGIGEREDIIYQLIKTEIQTFLINGWSVVVDNTNLKYTYVKDLILSFKYLADIEVVEYNIAVEKAIIRDSKRPKLVGSDIILNQKKNFESLIINPDYINNVVNNQEIRYLKLAL